MWSAGDKAGNSIPEGGTACAQSGGEKARRIEDTQVTPSDQAMDYMVYTDKEKY